MRKSEVPSGRNGDSGADAAFRGANGRATGKSPTLPRSGTRLLAEIRFPAFHLLEEAGISCRRVEVIQSLLPQFGLNESKAQRPASLKRVQAAVVSACGPLHSDCAARRPR